MKTTRPLEIGFEHSEGWNVALFRSGTDQLVTAVSIMAQVFPPDDMLTRVLTRFGWLGFGTGGAALSYNPESGSFVLWRSIDAETADPDRMNRELLRVIGFAARIRQPLLDALAETPAGAEEEAPEDGPVAHRV